MFLSFIVSVLQQSGRNPSSRALEKHWPRHTGIQCILSVNPYLTNGFSHYYHLGESTFIFRGARSDFLFFIQFFDEIPLSKQNSPRWDAAFCGVTSGAMLFAYVP